LEVSGSERLFGDRVALLQRLFASDAPALVLQHAQGATSLLALARLWAQTPDAAIDSLPLHSLAAARAHLPMLQRLGCSNWGQLRALPRGGLARRLGAALVDALDRAYGGCPEPYPWLKPAGGV
jgi:protein ImuB